MTQPASSDTTTCGIRVQAAAQFLPDMSDPDRRHYHFVYKIVITNVGDEPARLVARHWIILDSFNNRRDVKGPGVVGDTPHLGPGESYEYMSRCPLPTEWGTMEGSYEMERDDGTPFEARIGRFFLVPTAPPIQVQDG